jgi:1-acyl-sn-glycerol-3-phosphate acyltransferase
MWAVAVAALAAIAVGVRWSRSGQPLAEFLALGVVRLYAALWHRWRANGPAPFPAAGPGIVIANHTCSADPTFILAGSRRLISFLVAREHYNVSRVSRRILDWLRCVSVTRNGQDVCAIRAALRRLQEGRLVGVFPEGNLSGVTRGQIRPGRAGVALLALRSGAPVFPVYIAGGPRTEKLLPSWVFPSKVAVRVVYGPAVDLSAFHGRRLNRKTLEEVTAYLMDHVAALRPPPSKKL